MCFVILGAIPAVLAITVVCVLASHFLPTPKAQVLELHSAANVQFFRDVNSDHPNFAAISFLKQHDMIEGYADGTFQPEKLVTRAELLKFLFEVQKIYPSPAVYRACFLDVYDEWFAPYVCYAKAKKLLDGTAKVKFSPSETITKADALKILLPAFNMKNSTINVDDVLLNRGQLAEILYSFLR